LAHSDVSVSYFPAANVLTVLAVWLLNGGGWRRMAAVPGSTAYY